VSQEAFVCDAVRTPIGRYGGALSTVRGDDLAAVPLKALIERNELDPAAIDDVILGCANQAGEDNRNVARMAALLSGLPETVGGTTINRLCASGLDAVGTAARAIRSGDANLLLAGGIENMSRAPFVMPKADSAFSRNNAVFDTTIGWRFVNPRMKTAYGVDSMPDTGENVARDFQVSRADQDAFACAVSSGQAQRRLADGLLRRSRRSSSPTGRDARLRSKQMSIPVPRRLRMHWQSSGLWSGRTEQSQQATPPGSTTARPQCSSQARPLRSATE
jgi:acetyl-CoA acetyltransferase